ncbi:MAG: hypothetical protein QM777_22970 [Pseudorhodoferax sp.]
MDRLIDDGRIDYLHASLYNLLAGTPLDDTSGQTTARQFIARVAGRVPLMAAGQLRTPEEARRAIALGLPLVALGRGLAMNPQWVERARQGRDDAIDTTLDLSREPGELQVPDKLWAVIQATPGWFPRWETAVETA